MHPNHLLLVNGMSGAGKTMAAIILLIRALSQGAGGFIIDRAGHFAFLASLIPGAASVEVGGEEHAITRGTSRTPAGLAQRRSTICSHCTRCCSVSTTRDATATG